MVDKTQLENMVKHNLKVKKILFIISICLFSLAVAFLVGFIVLFATGYDIVMMPEIFVDLTLRYIFIDLFEFSLAGAIVTILFSTLIFGRRAQMAQSMLDLESHGYHNYAELEKAESNILDKPFTILFPWTYNFSKPLAFIIPSANSLLISSFKLQYDKSNTVIFL